MTQRDALGAGEARLTVRVKKQDGRVLEVGSIDTHIPDHVHTSARAWVNALAALRETQQQEKVRYGFRDLDG